MSALILTLYISIHKLVWAQWIFGVVVVVSTGIRIQGVENSDEQHGNGAENNVSRLGWNYIEGKKYTYIYIYWSKWAQQRKLRANIPSWSSTIFFSFRFSFIYCITFVHFAFINSPVVHCTFTRYALGANPSRQHNDRSGQNEKKIIMKKMKQIEKNIIECQNEKERKEKKRNKRDGDTSTSTYTSNGKWRRSLKQCRMYCRNNQIVVIQPY